MSCLISPIYGGNNKLVAVIQILNKRKSEEEMTTALQNSVSPTKNTNLMSFQFEDFKEEDSAMLYKYCLQLGPAMQDISQQPCYRQT